MDPFDRYRKRVRSVRARYGFVNEPVEESDADLRSGYSFTAEQLLDLAWKTAGATMAALGVKPEELPTFGNLVAPTIHELLREYGITVPEDYRRSR
jgi:hypothetical protein